LFIFSTKVVFAVLHYISCLCSFTFQIIDAKYVKDLAAQTSGFMPRDILALIADAGVSFAHKVTAEMDSKEISKDEKVLQEISSATQSDEKHFCKEDIMSSLERAKKRNRAALGTPKVKHLSPSVQDHSDTPYQHV
jgi:hypothetical protein